MSIDFAEFDNSGVDKSVGVGEPGGFGGGQAVYGGADFRDAVLRIVEERLEEETERRAWRRGSEVF